MSHPRHRHTIGTLYAQCNGVRCKSLTRSCACKKPIQNRMMCFTGVQPKPGSSMCTCLGRRGSPVLIRPPRPLFGFRGSTGVPPWILPATILSDSPPSGNPFGPSCRGADAPSSRKRDHHRRQTRSRGDRSRRLAAVVEAPVASRNGLRITSALCPRFSGNTNSRDCLPQAEITSDTPCNRIDLTIHQPTKRIVKLQRWKQELETAK